MKRFALRWAFGLGLVLCLASCGGASETSARTAPPDPLDDISAEELFRRGVLLGEHGDFIRSEQYISAAVDRGFPEEQAMPALMKACVQSSRLDAALSYALPYLARHPSQWPLRMLVASIHMGLAQPQRARDELDRVLRDAPEEPAMAHYFLGVLLRDELDDLERARTHFRRYLALAPEGDHREEALAALPDEERDLPVRIQSGSDNEGGPIRVDAPDEPDEAEPDAPEGAAS